MPPQEVHGADPLTSLYVPSSHWLHGPPSAPVYLEQGLKVRYRVEGLKFRYRVEGLKFRYRVEGLRFRYRV